MDTFSHAAWGYASLRWKDTRLAWWGALAGAAPDILYFIPFMLHRVFIYGWSRAWDLGKTTPGMWVANGPPLPPAYQDAYQHYYVYSHSLLLLVILLGILYLTGVRKWLWLGIPYALHLFIDFPTHERFRTQLFFPLSHWTITGLHWSDPRIFIPNLILLVLTYLWIMYVKFAKKKRSA